MADTGIPTNPQEYVPILKAWGELRDVAIWGLIILGVMIAICFIVYIIIQSKKAKIAAEAKNHRAKTISSSNDKLSSSIDEMKNSIIQLTSVIQGQRQINEEMVWPTLDGLKSEINKLSSKTSGIIDRHDSINIIRIVFFKAIYYEVRDHLNEFMFIKESDFKTREQYLADKARTNIGEVLGKYKGTLQGFKLSINPNLFFKLDSTESTERFILVDIIWSDLKTYLNSQLRPEQKFEEISLKLFNIIKDYLNTIISEIEEDDEALERKSESRYSENRMTPVDPTPRYNSEKHPSSEWSVTKSFASPIPFKTPER